VGAHVIKALRPVDRGQGSGAHSHDLQFQMVYVLKVPADGPG
jgi:quercetin dioxygenase-like cupin family protein